MADTNKNTAETKINPPVEPPISAGALEEVPAPTTPETPQEEMVTVPKSTLDAILNDLANLKETQELQLKVEDKNKLLEIERMRRSGKLVKNVKLRQMNGQSVIGWKMLDDEVYVDENGRLIEKQTVQVWLEDGTKLEIPFRTWATLTTYISFEVTRESKDEEGDLFFTVRAKDGKEFEIGSKYVN